MEEEARVKKGSRVCVTGAGGFVASWLVKLLLSHGYNVHATVRDPTPDPKRGRFDDSVCSIKRSLSFLSSAPPPVAAQLADPIPDDAGA